MVHFAIFEIIIESKDRHNKTAKGLFNEGISCVLVAIPLMGNDMKCHLRSSQKKRNSRNQHIPISLILNMQLIAFIGPLE